MKFVGVRDFRTKSTQIWKKLRSEKNIVITSNGKPIAILSATSEDRLEVSLMAIRRAQAREALATIRLEAGEKSTETLSLLDINAEINAFRKGKNK